MYAYDLTAPTRLDMRRVASCSSPARLFAVSVAATHASAASVAGPAIAATRLDPVGVEAGRGERLGEPPGLRHAERLQALEQRVLGVGGVERVERRAARRPRDGLAVQGDQLRGVVALDARLHEAPQRRPDHVDRLDHLRRQPGRPRLPGC